MFNCSLSWSQLAFPHWLMMLTPFHVLTYYPRGLCAVSVLLPLVSKLAAASYRYVSRVLSTFWTQVHCWLCDLRIFFPQSVTCFFIGLAVFFTQQNLCISSISAFPFTDGAFEVMSKNSLPCFILVLKVLCVTFYI